MSTPPTKPTVLVLVALAAATPARYEASCSAKTRDATLSPSTTESTMPKVVFGYLLGDGLQRGAVGEPDADDRVVALLGQRGEALLLVGVGLTVGGLDVGGLVAELLLRLLQTGVRRVVEGLVALAADVVRDGKALAAAALAAAAVACCRCWCRHRRWPRVRATRPPPRRGSGWISDASEGSPFSKAPQWVLSSAHINARRPFRERGFAWPLSIRADGRLRPCEPWDRKVHWGQSTHCGGDDPCAEWWSHA